MNDRRQHWPLLGYLLCAVAFTASVQQVPFFWDSVQLASKHAHFFYENSLRWAVLPPEIDSGHPPLLGYYLACCWMVFGKTLPVGHWAMLPFLLAIVVFLYRLALRVAAPKWAFWLLPLVLLDPVLLGQAALVSPDMLLLAFFLAALLYLFWPESSRYSRIWAAVALLGLSAVSLRGMLCAAGLGVALLLWQGRAALHPRLWWPFVPGAVLGLAFLLWHRQAAGWSGFHAASPWAAAFEPVDARGVLRNVAVLAWRWLDLGRTGSWIALMAAAWGAWQHRGRWPERRLLLLLGCVGVALSYSALRYANLSAHRYFLPLFVLLQIVVFQAVVRMRRTDFYKKILLSSVIIFLTGGNFWIYPHGISMDWDSTLAHVPYHGLRQEAVAFLRKHELPLGRVGSAFPNLNTGEQLLLNGEQDRCVEINFVHNDAVFVSNIYNDFTVEQRQFLQKNWTLAWRREQGRVWVEIWQPPSTQ